MQSYICSDKADGVGDVCGGETPQQQAERAARDAETELQQALLADEASPIKVGDSVSEGEAELPTCEDEVSEFAQM
jgi:hypothetical protein